MRNKEALLKAQRAYYKRNRSKRMLSTKLWKERNAEHIKQYELNRYIEKRELIISLKNNPCADCKNTFPTECMDFDHLDGNNKTTDVSDLYYCSRDRLFNEIAKCELVCANCHRIRTTKRKNER